MRIAQSNNFMGLICRSNVLNTVPALVEAIKVAGLVLVSDASDGDGGIVAEEVGKEVERKNTALPAMDGVPEGVDGILKANGIMRFNETVDM